MVVKKRERNLAQRSPEFDDFVSGGGTLAPEPPSRPAESAKAATRRQAPKAQPKEGRPVWAQRAETDKKTEGQPLRYNRSQAQLLAHAKAVEGRDYSKILAELIWPVLEERYGKDVPFPDA